MGWMSLPDRLKSLATEMRFSSQAADGPNISKALHAPGAEEPNGLHAPESLHARQRPKKEAEANYGIEA